MSYSNKDKEQVRCLATDLRKEGIAVWLDEWEILVGDSITQKIQAGLRECRFLALWVTEEALKSGWVQKEWQAKYFEEIQKDEVSVLPLLAEKCELPPLLRDKKYADFTLDYSIGLKELLNVLKGSQKQRSAESEGSALSLSLEYFNIDISCCGFERTESSSGDTHLGRIWKRACEDSMSHTPDISIPKYVKDMVDNMCSPGVPIFSRKRTTNIPSSSPVFIMTVYNGTARKLVLHTIELEVFQLFEAWGRGDTETLPILAMYDIEMPLENGVYNTPMNPQIGVAVGDVASFHVRLLPPIELNSRWPSGTYLLNFRVKASAGAAVESGVFYLDL